MTGTVPRSSMLAGPGIMLLSAAIFGYFGFVVRPGPMNTAGEFVLFFAMLGWTLKLTAIAFLLAAVMTFVNDVAGNLLYGIAGLVSAALLVIIAIMDVMDASNAAAISPVLLLLFAAWNGYGSWTGIQAVRLVRATDESGA